MWFGGGPSGLDINIGVVVSEAGQQTEFDGMPGGFHAGVRSVEASGPEIVEVKLTDPDGHLWAVVWNPRMLPSD